MNDKSVIDLCLEIDQLGKELQRFIDEGKEYQKKLDAWWEAIDNRRKEKEKLKCT